MIDLIKRVFAIASGGRPMRRIGFAFTDIVSGKPVHYFEDFHGTIWLAEHRWSGFRVPLGARHELMEDIRP